jgi:hypothetical protein
MEFKAYNDKGDGTYYVAHSNMHIPNGTRIKSFDIRSYGLNQSQKDFLTDYYDRIDDVRHQQEINAIYGAQDEAYDDYVRYMEYQNSKPKNSYYVGTNCMVTLDPINLSNFLFFCNKILVSEKI